ncbi:uncharacterized protein B4U79_07743 [Dinothrombium tinctorium]|uniref:Uncharacterized protein n=1 Tax=Dinothrombium tinctorium TaxID=1965070 RepID=A0A3S3NB32_9ACAR|nr:uncharacterized protein B4U79_07743 [Dinothrombium tinctorium]
MAAIHELSMITPLSELELFAVPPTQTSIEKDLCTEHRPIATIDSRSSIEFFIHSAADEYINLRESSLYLKMKITISKNDKTLVKAEDWNGVKPVKNFMHSLFQQVSIIIGDTQINSSSTTYAYRAFFDSFFGASKEAKESFLSAVELDEISRNTFRESSAVKEFDLMGRLHLDLTFQDRALIGGSTIRLKLIPNDPKFFLNVNDGLSAEVTFIECSLFAHRSKVSKEILEAHQSALQISPAKYPITRTEVKTSTINQGSLDVIIENLVSGQLPRRLYLGFVEHDAYNGNFKKDPFQFQHFDINFLCCYVDGQQFPAKPFTPNFKKGLYIREYLSLFEASNQIFGEPTLNLNRQQYLNGKVLFGFNFAPDLSDGCCKSHSNLIHNGTLRVEVHFAEPLPSTVNVIAYCEFDNIIEIGVERNAIVNFV